MLKTKEERQKEQAEIERGDWPWYPLLPVVLRGESRSGGMPDAGVMHFANVREGKIVVYLVNIFEVKTGNDLLNAERKEYADWDAYFDAGWEVD